MNRLLLVTLLSLLCSLAHSAEYNKHEWRLGLLAHNKGPIASETEDGPDINIAYHYLMKAYSWGGAFAHGGAVINLADGTSYVYTGLNTQIPFGESPFFFEVGGGFAIHDGDLEKKSKERREMGSRVLFHFESSFGYNFNNGMSLSFFFDHISNGSILNDDDNKGLDTYGLRLGYSY
ncbi:Lipid A 3-O-deacylase (PagL) [Spongiibacter sp. IMCC21906]|uniref:acyloxyacyl hydrolase n=1 Tax=Spongiibacter sp. IMCC21906 TaxID=1620392 RepID=UPI00062DEE5E|nr:acyloxyacyl hydrolase [Spongiibacter sp. IMCC21906]AKH69909.1 Lipid A 3-O-deacylase (PagL) [Spongiibacter sp. IMCC21906]